MEVFGKILKAVMERENVSNHELATVLSKADSAISHLLSGRTKSVDARTSQAISSALHTPANFWSDLKTAEKAGTTLPIDVYLRELGIGTGSEAAPGILVDHQVKAMIQKWNDVHEDGYEDSTFVLEPFDTRRLKAASYDTRIGGYWTGSPRSSKPISITDANPLSLGMGETRYVHSLEHFRLPADVVGRVGPTVEFLTKGLDVAHGPLISPLFQGRLTVRVRNQTEEDITLTSEMRFIKVVFEKLQADPETREKTNGLDSLVLSSSDIGFLKEEQRRLKQELEVVERAMSKN